MSNSPQSTDHAPFSLLLDIDGKEQRFVTPSKVSGTLFRVAVQVSSEIEEGMDILIDLDSHLQFVCDVFGNQFGITELEEGLHSHDVLKTVYATTFYVMGQVTFAMEMLTKNVDVENIKEEAKKKQQ